MAAGGVVMKPKQYAGVSNEVKYKKQPFIQCRACGTIKFSKNVNNFLSTNPTTLILSSLLSEFWQRIQIWHKKNLFWAGGGGSVVEKGASSIGKK